MKYLVIAFMLLLPYGLFAQPLSEGAPIEAMQFKDQFEKNLAITAQTQQLIVVFSKIEGEKVKAFLEANPTYLREKNALYLMDITPVPGMVMSMFMLPKFKKYPYSIGLIEDEKLLAQFPKKENFITFMTLENFKIISVEFKEIL
jgi:hypothetical protein